MQSLEAQCFGKILSLLIDASSKRREQLLAILPYSMDSEVKFALITQKTNKYRWSVQKYNKGLLNHCFRKVIQIFAEKDAKETVNFLKPLINQPSLRYVYYLLIRYHEVFKWRTKKSDYPDSDYNEYYARSILLQHRYSSEPLPALPWQQHP
jgi:hypothetical protein